jgi:hypothetical protein
MSIENNITGFKISFPGFVMKINLARVSCWSTSAQRGVHFEWQNIESFSETHIQPTRRTCKSARQFLIIEEGTFAEIDKENINELYRKRLKSQVSAGPPGSEAYWFLATSMSKNKKKNRKGAKKSAK